MRATQGVSPVDNLTYLDRHRPSVNPRGLSLLLAKIGVTDNSTPDTCDVTDNDSRDALDMTDAEIQEEIQLLRDRLMTLTITLQYRDTDDQPTKARRRQPAPVRRCAVCETEYQPKRRDSHTCSPRCRQRAHRRRNGSQKAIRINISEPSP